MSFMPQKDGLILPLGDCEYFGESQVFFFEREKERRREGEKERKKERGRETKKEEKKKRRKINKKERNKKINKIERWKSKNSS